MKKKQFEISLREMGERYHKALDSLMEGCQIIGYDWRYLYINDACAEQARRPKKELLGRTMMEVFPGIESTEMFSVLKRCLKERTQSQIVNEFKYPNGEISWFELRFQPVPEGVFILSIDITERKLAEEELRDAHQKLIKKAAELESANEDLSQYAYVVSHDIKAPLRAVRNYADFLREDLEDHLQGETKGYLDNLSKAVRHAEQLVDDLLQLSRTGRREIELEEINLNLFIPELIRSIETPEDVQINIIQGTTPFIETEPVLLKQILQNLIDNAMKFNQSAKKIIEIGWRECENNEIIFTVKDNGLGIEPRFQEKIFGTFQRLHTDKEYKGTGIGLAIVKKAVSRLGGQIRIESEPGIGSTFIVNLPQSVKERELCITESLLPS